jgi:hypothetical protein
MNPSPVKAPPSFPTLAFYIGEISFRIQIITANTKGKTYRERISWLQVSRSPHTTLRQVYPEHSQRAQDRLPHRR